MKYFCGLSVSIGSNQHSLNNRTRISRGALVAAFLLVLVAGCTTERDGFSYRTFHNTTARFNGYFYAKESMREASVKLFDEHEEDWDEILPIFIYGNEETRQSVYPEMERIIEKTNNVIAKHNMEISKRQSKDLKRPEMNKWIDDCYLLLGQAYFLKGEMFRAEEFLRFATKKYKSPQMQSLGNAWYAKIFMEKGDWKKAKLFLDKAIDAKDVEDEHRAETYLIYAEYYIRQNEYKDAVKMLEQSLEYTKKRKDRARPLFILAQLKKELGKSQEAIENYQAVVKCKPYYEMEFYARINQALAFSRRGGNPAEIRETLYKMLKDDKNEEYRDQIYYALADLDLEERNRPGGIDNLEKSLRANTDNQKQRAKSYLRLADLYFDDRDYEPAQAYYDSCFQNIAEDHKRYTDIKNKATSLTELVTHLRVIDRQDSLQALCPLAPDELDARLLEIQNQIREELIAERERAERDAERALNDAQAGGGGATSNFWPYNPVLRTSGYDNFLSQWGDRPLEDNWRRSNKGFQAFDSGDPDDPNQTPDGTDTPDESFDPNDIESQVPSIEELRADLPCSDSLMTASDNAISQAYYQSGVIYKEKLEDDENAIESWQDMSSRMDDSEFHPLGYYQLYRTFLAKELEGGANPFGDQRETSAYWANRIKQRYPGSIWAGLIDNPDYKDEQERQKASELAAYEAAYTDYTRRQYVDLIIRCDEIIREEPDNHLLCKYRFLRAMCIGNMDRQVGQRNNYIEALEAVTGNCPEGEEGVAAQRILDELAQESGAPGASTEPKSEATPSPYTYDDRAQHFFALVFNMDRGNINEVKATVSDFNKEYFNSANLITAANLLGREKHIVLVKSFNRLEDAGNYLATFRGNTDALATFNGPGYETYLISKGNYLQLFKTKALDAYRTFFQEYYP